VALIGAPIAERTPRRLPTFDVQLRAAATRARYPGAERLAPSAPFGVVVNTVAATVAGSVIAPGSAHPSGVRYEWDGGGGRTPVNVRALPELPGSLQAAAHNGNGHNWGTPPEPDTELPVSERHDGLTLIAGSLIARRVYEPDLLAGALLEANRVRCKPPKPEAEVRAIAKWAASSDTAAEGRVEHELARRLFAAWRAMDERGAS
jgi:hypothetical protein